MWWSQAKMSKLSSMTFIYVLGAMNVRTKTRELDGPTTSAALMALARLLARQAAHEFPSCLKAPAAHLSTLIIGCGYWRRYQRN
jgi:hypothetical protein